MRLSEEQRIKLDAILEGAQEFLQKVDELADYIPDMTYRAPIEIGAKGLEALARFLERILERGGPDLTPEEPSAGLSFLAPFRLLSPRPGRDCKAGRHDWKIKQFNRLVCRACPFEDSIPLESSDDAL